MHKLIIEDDEGRTTVVPLVRDELTIGRKEGNSIRLTERNVSRRHARLFRRNTEICVEDFGSYTGVRVNGTRISAPTALRDTDQVLIGDYKLFVRSEAAADSPMAPTPAMTSALVGMEHGAVTGGAGAGIGGPGTAAAAFALPASDSAGGTPEPMDAAPTIPLQTLEEQGRAAAAALAEPARLVVVSTELAGMEFSLDRASLVIGRTEENDIMVNHASISRHHAKIVRDGDRYTVVDLQSANGVRVAGESYERVDLQPGDVVELGHVKMRFVGPDEEWTFEGPEVVPRSRRALRIGGALGGIVLAGVLVLVLQGRKQPPPPPVTVLPPAPVTPSPDTLFAEASAAAQAENWDKAVSALDLLLSRPPGDQAGATVATRAVELKRKVDLERRSADIFASFEKAVADKEPDVALSRFDEIPSDSTYKGRAEPALTTAKTLFLAAHLDFADSARAQGRCDEAAAEIEKVQQIDPENQQARDILKKCKRRMPPVARASASGATAPTPAPVGARGAASAASPPVSARAAAIPVPAPRPVAVTGPRPTVARAGGHTSSRAEAQTSTTTRAGRASTGARAAVTTNTTTSEPVANAGTPATAEEAQAEAADLIRQAREAWMRQQCGSAIDLSRRALRLRSGANEAHQIIAVCACSTKDREGALRSYTRLDERSRAMVRTLCARNGVELIE